MADFDSLFVDILAAAFESFGSDVEHFKTVSRFADEGAESYGDGEADHSRAGNSDSHGVFYDVSAEEEFDAVGERAEGFGGFCHGEGHGCRFGATDSGHDFLFDQRDDVVDLFFFHGSCYCLTCLRKQLCCLSLNIRWLEF